MSPAATEPVPVTHSPDYAPTIRAEIEADVRKLLECVEDTLDLWEGDGWVLMRGRGSIQPLEVRLGYLVNTHHGRDLYREGDLIEGLPVRIDRSYPRTITVLTNVAWFEREVEELDDDGVYRWTTTDDERQVVETITW